MDLFSAQHLAVLVVTAVVSVGLGLAVRRAPPGAPWVDLACRGLGVALVVNEIGFHVVLALDEGLSARTDLPLHLTDAATVAAVIALWRPSPLAFELTLLLGADRDGAGAPHGGPAPRLPDHRWSWFVVAHSGVVVVAILLAWGRRPSPWRSSGSWIARSTGGARAGPRARLVRCPTTPPRSPSDWTATRRTPCGRARSCASAPSAGPGRP